MMIRGLCIIYSPKHKSSRTITDHVKTGFEAIRSFFFGCVRIPRKKPVQMTSSEIVHQPSII